MSETDAEKHRAGFVERLRLAQENDDLEVAHGDADDVLCELLTELGYSDIVAEWQKVGKWYA